MAGGGSVEQEELQEVEQAKYRNQIAALVAFTNHLVVR